MATADFKALADFVVARWSGVRVRPAARSRTAGGRVSEVPEHGVERVEEGQSMPGPALRRRPRGSAVMGPAVARHATPDHGAHRHHRGSLDHSHPHRPRPPRPRTPARVAASGPGGRPPALRERRVDAAFARVPPDLLEPDVRVAAIWRRFWRCAPRAPGPRGEYRRRRRSRVLPAAGPGAGPDTQRRSLRRSLQKPTGGSRLSQLCTGHSGTGRHQRRRTAAHQAGPGLRNGPP
jgi:hypothetical protein